MRAILAIAAAVVAAPVQADPIGDFVYAYSVFGGDDPASVVEGLDGDWLELASYARVSSRRDNPEWVRVYAETHMESFCGQEPPSRGVLRLETTGQDSFTFIRPGYEKPLAQRYQWVEGSTFMRSGLGDDGADGLDGRVPAEIYRVSEDILVIRDAELYNTANPHHIFGRCPEGTALASLDRWVGDWTTGIEEDITISVADGGLAIEGYATYGATDPERVELGSVNTGMFSGLAFTDWIDVDGVLRFSVDGEEIAAPGQSEDDMCAIAMTIDGDVLDVEDNYRCGGANVSFSGTYHRD